MTAGDLRRTLTEVAGTLEYLRATLGRAEHSTDRVTIKETPRALQAQTDVLLLLRARLCAAKDREPASASR
jgi:hypothetical protein